MSFFQTLYFADVDILMALSNFQIRVTKTAIYFDRKSKYVSYASYKQPCYTSCKIFSLCTQLILEIFCPGPVVSEIQNYIGHHFHFQELLESQCQQFYPLRKTVFSGKSTTVIRLHYVDNKRLNHLFDKNLKKFGSTFRSRIFFYCSWQKLLTHSHELCLVHENAIKLHLLHFVFVI